MKLKRRRVNYFYPNDMAYTRKMNEQLLRLFENDPISVLLMKKQIMWKDVPFTAKELREIKEYSETGNGSMILAGVRREVEKILLRKYNNEYNDDMDDDIDENENDIDKLNTIVRPIKTIIARNLPRDITSDDLQYVFGKHGSIRDIYIPLNKDKTSIHYGSVKGFALIKYYTIECSNQAFRAEYNKLFIKNKKIKIEFANEDRS